MLTIPRRYRDRKWGGYLLPALALLALTARGHAGDASYTITGLTGGTQSGSGTLQNAITAIEGSVDSERTGYGNTYAGTVAIDLVSGGSANAVSGSTPSYWNLDGINGSTTTGTVNGFQSVRLSGASPTAKYTLTGTGGTASMLLRIVNVENGITVSNLKLTRGNYNGDGTGTAFGGEVGGAGMTLGSTGVSISRGPQTVSVSNVDAENNTITVTTSSTTVNNVFGGGILVNAHGLKSDGLGGLELDDNRSAVTFDSVNLRGNSITLTKTAGNTDGASARGGGARVAYGKLFTYTNGEVSDNKVTLSYGSHAAGAGLSVDDNQNGEGAYENITLSGVSFLRNEVKAINASDVSTSPNISYARGGGFYFLGTVSGSTLTEITLGTGTTFEDNKATGTINGTTDTVHAHGGAAFIFIDTANVTLTGTTFTNNQANSENASAWGGALALSTAGYATNGSLDATGAAFTGNSAIGYTEAFGGALYAQTGLSHTLTNTAFLKNTATAASDSGTAQGGGAAFETGNHVISGGSYQGNKAESTGLAGTASGGALYFEGGNQAITDVQVIGNTAIAGSTSALSTGNAYGGGIYLGVGDSNITNAVIDGNSAISKNYNGDAQGGGIYFEHGILNITDSSITNNRTDSRNAKGSAIYMEMDETASGSTTDSVLTLTSTAGKTFEISGNVANGSLNDSGIYFGNTSGSSQYDGQLNLKGAGNFAILNPVKVEMNNNMNFTMLKASGTGNLTWDGVNSFQTTGGNATITLNGGTLTTGKYFTLKGVGNTNFTVNLNKVNGVVFDLSRDSDTALFDFSEVTGTGKTLNVTPQTALSTNFGREVKSFYKEYYIVKGMEDDAVDMSWFKVAKSDNEYVSLSLRDDTNGNLLAGVGYSSPFDVTVNTREAQDALESLVKGKNAANVSDAEFAAMVRNANNITPETFMEHGWVTMNAADLMARNALNMGIRWPHKARLGTGEMTVTGGGSSDGYGYDEYYGAYPSLADCSYDDGLRIWAGYVGDWSNVESHGGYNGYQVDRNGFILGANYDFGDFASLGVYGGYTYAKVTARHAESEIKSDVGHFGVLARWSPITANREFSLYGEASYHYADNDSYRRLGDYQAKGAFEQGVWTATVGAEYQLTVGGFNLVPHAEGRFMNIDQDDLLEGGNSNTISSTTGFDKSTFITRMGVEASKDFLLGNTVVSPALNVDWRHNYGDQALASMSYFLNDPAAILHSVTSSRQDRDSVDIGVALRTLKDLGTSKFGFNVAYNLNLSRNSDTHSIYAGVELGF